MAVSNNHNNKYSVLFKVINGGTLQRNLKYEKAPRPIKNNIYKITKLVKGVIVFIPSNPKIYVDNLSADYGILSLIIIRTTQIKLYRYYDNPPYTIDNN